MEENKIEPLNKDEPAENLLSDRLLKEDLDEELALDDLPV